jgi:plastocyanin
MRRILLPLIALLAFACVASAATGQRTVSKTVSITANGFSPDSVTIRPGDTVTWTNKDSTAHQIVSDTGIFKSNKLQPGESFSYRFDVESGYSYHDATKTSMTGTVNVLTNSVSVGVTRIRTIFGSPVTVFGSIPSGATGETVTLTLSTYGKAPVTKNVVTDGGTYEYKFRPSAITDVSAAWNGTTSQTQPRIGVRPLVIFRMVNRKTNLFYVRVKAAKARFYAHKTVRIQRQNARGIWQTTRIVTLNPNGWRLFRGKFPRGTTKAQAWTAKAPGYVPGFSVLKLISR